jgi:hypothetical protein
MLFDCPLVKGINEGGFDGSTCRGDVSRYNVEPGLCPPGDKDSGTLPGKYSCDGSTDGPSSSVNNGVLIF